MCKFLVDITQICFNRDGCVIHMEGFTANENAADTPGDFSYVLHVELYVVLTLLNSRFILRFLISKGHLLKNYNELFSHYSQANGTVV